MKYSKKDIEEFIRESNAIEGEYREQAFEDALKAWDYLSRKIFLDHDVILTTHDLLMKNINPSVAGRWRNYPVWVGSRAGIDWERIYWAIEGWINMAHQTVELPGDSDVHVKMDHVEFEKIHPFGDGNGRIGRLLYLWERRKIGLPIKIFYEKDRQEYYKWFKEE